MEPEDRNHLFAKCCYARECMQRVFPVKYGGRDVEEHLLELSWVQGLFVQKLWRWFFCLLKAIFM
ncbi:hypothetical protein LINPERPRIM_LOCUS38177, partial [Linum perenne]